MHILLNCLPFCVLGLFYISEFQAEKSLVGHPAAHFIRHAVEARSRAKKKIKAPTKMAPKMLAAGNVMAKSTTASKIVPSAPVKSAGSTMQRHALSLEPPTAPVKSTTGRYTTAMPKSTHKKAGVTATTAVKVKNAATMPKMILATAENAIQFSLQLQPKNVIKFTSRANICKRTDFAHEERRKNHFFGEKIKNKKFFKKVFDKWDLLCYTNTCL